MFLAASLIHEAVQFLFLQGLSFDAEGELRSFQYITSIGVRGFVSVACNHKILMCSHFHSAGMGNKTKAEKNCYSKEMVQLGHTHTSKAQKHVLTSTVR